MFHSWNAHLRTLYREKQYNNCREGCLQLLEYPYVPNYTRIETLQLLSCVAGGPGLAEQFLQQAHGRLEKLDADKEAVKLLKSENAAMLQKVKQDLEALEASGALEKIEITEEEPYETADAEVLKGAEEIDEDMDAFLKEREEQEQLELRLFGGAD